MYERIACIGGASLDRKVEPIERLRPGTSNPVTTEVCSGGTARNIAEALARLGHVPSLFSRIGSDAAGDRIADELMGLHIDLDGIDQSRNSPTASYTAVMNETGELVYGLADMEILDQLDESWLDSIAERLCRHDLWIVDANLPEPVLVRLAGLAPEGVRIFADPVSVEKSLRLVPILDRIDTLFPDRPEAAALSGADLITAAALSGADLITAAALSGADPITAAASSGTDPRTATALAGANDDGAGPATLGAALLERGARRVLITLGDAGIWVEDPPRHERVPAMATSAVVNVTGAGDCFVAGYVFAQAAGSAIDPVRCGLAAAALAVESARTVPVELTAERLLERYRGSR